MRLFLQIAYYFIFALILGLAALSIRSGENIIRSMVLAGHESSEGNKIGIFLEVVSNEAQAVFEQVYVNTVYTRLDSISGLTHISKNRLLEATGFTEGMELNAGQIYILKSKFSSYPWIRTYSIQKNFLPDRMSVEIKEAKPAFIADYLGVSWVVSDEGVLLEPSSEIVESKLQLEIMKLPRIPPPMCWGLRKICPLPTTVSTRFFLLRCWNISNSHSRPQAK